MTTEHTIVWFLEPETEDEVVMLHRGKYYAEVYRGKDFFEAKEVRDNFSRLLPQIEAFMRNAERKENEKHEVQND